MRQKLFKRLEKLEVATTRLLDGPWTWTAKAAEVKRRTLEALSPEELVLVTESFNGKNHLTEEEFKARYPQVSAKYEEAFERAAREVPAPYPMISVEMWGEW